MALTKLTADVENHQKLDNNPSDDPGFVSRAARADALRVLFDKAAVDTKNYINGTLIPEIEAGLNLKEDKTSAVPILSAAQASADAAEESATAAAGSAGAAANSAAAASGFAETATTKAGQATGSAGDAADSAALSQSWAVGGTESRTGEDTNNAKYWSEAAKVKTGEPGADGKGIQSINRTSGSGAAGISDTFTITFTDGSTTTFQVYNGSDGLNSGDFFWIGDVGEYNALTPAEKNNTDIIHFIKEA